MARHHSSGMLVAIGLFKLVKAAVLVAAGVALFALAHDSDAAGTLVRWAHDAHLDPGGHTLRTAIAGIAGIEPGHRALIGGALFFYAAVFVVEGTGLVLRKSWAEWMTIGVTASLIPLEVYEIAREVTVVRVAVLVVNLATVAYLAWRVRDERRLRDRA
jgi:uncharacterized membrane protein (DUF2068 family)